MKTSLPLFVTYGGGHVEIVLRLWHKMRQRHGIEAQILGLTSSAKVLRAQGIPFKQCLDYITPDGPYHAAMAIGKTVVGDSWDTSSPVEYDESCAYHGVSMIDLTHQLGETAATELYREKGRNGFWPTGFLQHLIETEAPSLTITTCNARMEGASVVASKAASVPSLRIDDLLGYTLLGLDAVDKTVDKKVDPDKLPDQMVVLNNSINDILVGSGVPARRIHALGQPVLSETPQNLADAELDPEMAAHVAGGGRAIAYFPTSEIFETSMPLVFQLARKYPDLLIVTKFHPSTRESEITKFLEDKPDNVTFRFSRDVFSILHSAEYIITESTTVLLTALFGQVKCVFLHFSDLQNFPQASEHPNCVTIHDTDKFMDSVAAFEAEILSNSAETSIPETNLFYNPANASERIVDLIKTLATQPK